ncbi:hypothetical protein [Arthrospiribacter ruber]|uniref:Uncharacterized protein n=1 Tax=Arthrospiribacter ruber TaxID=2487934 RepID=A0A951IZD0_9BACT|nr:hypothetical protein [Arthrospiribacter ruber]MBW3469094.1 hypothetical protein [Arthrospiribacter ruber]
MVDSDFCKGDIIRITDYKGVHSFGYLLDFNKRGEDMQYIFCHVDSNFKPLFTPLIYHPWDTLEKI